MGNVRARRPDARGCLRPRNPLLTRDIAGTSLSPVRHQYFRIQKRDVGGLTRVRRLVIATLPIFPPSEASTADLSNSISDKRVRAHIDERDAPTCNPSSAGEPEISIAFRAAKVSCAAVSAPRRHRQHIRRHLCTHTIPSRGEAITAQHDSASKLLRQRRSFAKFHTSPSGSSRQFSTRRCAVP